MAPRQAHGAAAPVVWRHSDDREQRRRLADAAEQLASHHTAPPGCEAWRREGSEETARGWRRSDRARRTPQLDAARLGGQIRSAQDGQVPAQTWRAEEPS